MPDGYRDSARLKAQNSRRTRRDEARWAAQAPSRKNRTIFTEEQHNALIAAYDADKYPTTIQKELLARQLGLAPIVVINWFQHRRQREPVKEKGGYVLNIPRNQPEGMPPSPHAFLDKSPSSSFLQIGSIVTLFPAGSENGDITKLRQPGEKPGLTSIFTTIPLSLRKGSEPTFLTNDSSGTVTSPLTDGSADSVSKGKPYYGRMQTVRPPLPGQILQNDLLPKAANAHIGAIRWELDPLYIAPYIDHGFKEAMLPRDDSAFTLRPSPLIRK
ncbi:hypothetical protein CPB86DRAFT_82569 [Serendipita vermifera]|nr:hypothetical protein CPB86DRAFT_82569 [Serendipita vermifera]